MKAKLVCVSENEWKLRVQASSDLAVEYDYRSEKQARFMAAVFALGPSKLPPANRILPLRSRPKRFAKRSASLTALTSAEIDEALGRLDEFQSPR